MFFLIKFNFMHIFIIILIFMGSFFIWFCLCRDRSIFENREISRSKPREYRNCIWHTYSNPILNFQPLRWRLPLDTMISLFYKHLWLIVVKKSLFVLFYATKIKEANRIVFWEPHLATRKFKKCPLVEKGGRGARKKLIEKIPSATKGGPGGEN